MHPLRRNGAPWPRRPPRSPAASSPSWRSAPRPTTRPTASSPRTTRSCKDAGLVEAGVPRELGGGGAEIAELCDMLRTLAGACGSTALAFSMHTHQVAVPAWRWRHQNVAAVEPLLRRVAAERLILVSSGGSDWIGGSGTARKVEGGYRITARKIFTSGATGRRPPDDRRDPARPRTARQSVIHFAAPMKAPEVTVRGQPGARSACAAPARTTSSSRTCSSPTRAVSLVPPGRPNGTRSSRSSPPLRFR